MARRWLDLGPIKMILLVERGYKGWLKANIFVDNSLPLSGQAPRTPTLDIHDQQNHDVDGDDGDQVDNDDDDDDLYIIGAVCHEKWALPPGSLL